MGLDNPNVLRIQLRQNLQCYWTRAEDLSLERISSIDLRAQDGTMGIKLCIVVQNGIFVQREGYLNKLIPWSNVDDLDIEGLPPGYIGRTLNDAIDAAAAGMPDARAGAPIASTASQDADKGMPGSSASNIGTAKNAPAVIRK